MTLGCNITDYYMSYCCITFFVLFVLYQTFFYFLYTPSSSHFLDRATVLEFPDTDEGQTVDQTGSHFGATGCGMLDFSLQWDTLTGLRGSSTSIDSESNPCERAEKKKIDQFRATFNEASGKLVWSANELHFCLSSKPVQVLVVLITVWNLLGYY